MIITKLETITYNIFYEEFFSNYLKIKEDKKFIILASIFLHTTYEVVINYSMRLYLRIWRGSDSPLVQHWYDKIERDSKLRAKIDYFCKNIKFKYGISNNVNKVIRFNGKLASMRNSLIHGHEISETTKMKIKMAVKKETSIKKQIRIDYIESLYNGFWDSLKIFFGIFEAIDIPKGMSQQFIERDIIQNSMNSFKVIENKLRINCRG